MTVVDSGDMEIWDGGRNPLPLRQRGGGGKDTLATLNSNASAVL